MKHQYYVYKIKFWDDMSEEVSTRYGIITAETSSEAVTKIEEYFCDDLLSFECNILEGDIAFISEEEYKRQLSEDFLY